MQAKLIVALFIAMPSIAADNPCAKDLKKFCPDIHTKKKAIACLKKHEAELSPECKKDPTQLPVKAKTNEAEMTKGDEKPSEISEACKNVKFKDPNFKECAKERMEIAKAKFNAYHDKLKAKKEEKLKKEKLEQEKLEKEKKTVSAKSAADSSKSPKANTETNK